MAHGVIASRVALAFIEWVGKLAAMKRLFEIRGGGLVCLVSLLLLTGCRSTYYAAWEKVGVEKRDLLKKRVVAAREVDRLQHRRRTDDRGMVGRRGWILAQGRGDRSPRWAAPTTTAVIPAAYRLQAVPRGITAEQINSHRLIEEGERQVDVLHGERHATLLGEAAQPKHMKIAKRNRSDATPLPE